MFRGELLNIMKKRGKKENRKKLKTIKKMKVGDSICINDYEIICVDKKIYTIVHPQIGIMDKTFDDLEEWIIDGRELD